MSITESEHTTLEWLDRIVHSPQVVAHLEPVVGRVRRNLADGNSVMAWEPIPLPLFGTDLPVGIQSGWVFILRAGTNTGAERHPNSHQRMMSFAGIGEMRTRADEKADWVSNPLVSDWSATLEQRWISIPRNVWHQPVVGPNDDWVVVSFHTVPAEELIEERPDSAAPSGTRQTHYVE